MRLIFSLIAVLLFTSCSTVQLPQSTPSPSPVEITPRDSSGVGEVTFVCKTCDDKEKEMLPKMQKKLNEVLHSECFAQRFIDPKYRSRLEQTNGMSRAEVIKKIQTTSVKDIPLVFYWPSWRQSKSVVGYTNAGSPEIYLNRRFRSDGSWGLCAEISNEIHETLHKMGFDHDYSKTERRPFSIPYTGNYASDSCCVETK